MRSLAADTRQARPEAAASPRRARDGFTFLFIALLVGTFVGVAAFAVDFSRMYLIHGELRNAAEAGALAGVNRMLSDDGASASDSAMAYVRVNHADGVAPDVTAADIVFGHWGADFTPTSGWSDPSTNAMQVTARHTGSYLFGPIYGLAMKDLQARAIASIGYVTATRCVRPVAIPYAELLKSLYPVSTPPVTYDLTEADVNSLRALSEANAIPLKIGSAGDPVVSGSFYAVREPPVLYANGDAGAPESGASDFSDHLSSSCAALPHLIAVGDWLAAENGNMAGPTRAGLATACGVAGNPTSFDCTPPLEYLIPIWDVADKTVASPNAFHVKYMGVFYVTRFDSKVGVLGYFSALHTNGMIDTIPGPLTSAALRR